MNPWEIVQWTVAVLVVFAAASIMIVVGKATIETIRKDRNGNA